jgi:putative two-component system response regulator
VNDRQLRLKAIESGADDVLNKPIDSFEIQTRIRNITRLNRYRSLLESRSDVSRMLDQVRRAYDQTIAGWALALELRDDETKGHSVRVTTWTVDLALQVGIKGEELEHVRRGALLHDIGKMGVPDAILRKSGPLDPNERRIMQRHPTLAYEMLSSVEYLAKSIHIPYCHHERWDGQGYPQGLSGDSIPYTARLFSIVDVYDALTSDRPYRQAWDSDKAMAYLKTQTGTHFDPDVVSAYSKLVRSGGLTKVAGQGSEGLYLRFE